MQKNNIKKWFVIPLLAFILAVSVCTNVKNPVSNGVLPDVSDFKTTVVINNTMTNGEDVSYVTDKIPRKYDSRNRGVITNAKSQASSKSCWAFATISLLESDYISQGLGNLKNTDFSESHLTFFAHNSISDGSPASSYNEGLNSSAPYAESGNWYVATAALARWSGIAQESSYPFPVGKSDTAAPLSESDRYIKDSGVIVKSAEQLDDNDDLAIKRWIIEHGSIAVSLYNSQAHYYNNDGTYAYYYNKVEEQNHQLVIVGWDDDFSVDNFNPGYRPKSAGAWLCKDSQGSEWGDDGFVWVSYETMGLTCFIGFTCQPAEKYDNNYTYNGYGWSTYLICSNNSYIANVFKNTNPEILKAVSFYTIQPNTTIQINVYTDLPENSTNPTDGTLQYTSSELLIKNPGYHTVDLGKEINLPPNTNFSVVIRYTHDSGEVQIPVESNGNKRNASYTSNKGESFIYSLGYSDVWNDSQQYGLCNVCIQAFTKNLF